MDTAADHATRAALRLRSLSWAIAGGACAGLIALLLQGHLEAALRAGGCGFFYGLLAFHLQRADPDDGHLQAGLVGAVCGITSLAAPLQVTETLPTVMMGALRGWLPLWLPLVGSALLLRGVNRLLPALRP
ncbi:MAG: hypothetical protein ACO289_09470 [Prochlorococcaceae cyanobacterium]